MKWVPDRAIFESILTDLTNPNATSSTKRVASIQAFGELLKLIHEFCDHEAENESNERVQLSLLACAGLCKAAETAAHGTVQLIKQGNLS